MKFTALLAASIMGFAVAPPAAAAIQVFGNGLASVCYSIALQLAQDHHVTPANPESCTLALEDGPLNAHDLVATHVNRGIVYMARSEFGLALEDFDYALNADNSIAEAWLNHGGVLIAMHRWADGIADIDRGLTLNPKEPEKAYFNRAVAHEALDDMKDAYFDYMKALELKPGWDLPANELERFSINRNTQGRLRAGS